MSSRRAILVLIGLVLLTLASFALARHWGSGGFGLDVEPAIARWRMDRAWAEINKGAELRIPQIFFFIIKYITPVFLLLIVVSFVFKPVGKVTVTDPQTGKSHEESRSWEPYVRGLFTGGPFPPWEWAGDGMIGKLLNRDVPDAKAQEQMLQALAKQKRAAEEDLQVTPEQRQGSAGPRCKRPSPSCAPPHAVSAPRLPGRSDVRAPTGP